MAMVNTAVMGDFQRNQLIGAVANRANQIRIKIALALLVGLLFNSFTGVAFAVGWCGAYIASQLVEAWLFRPKALERRLATRWGYAQLVSAVAISNLLFSSFGVAAMIQGGPGGTLAGALLITGAIVNAVTTTASSREIFLAGLIPQIVCFAFLPGVALGHGAGTLTASQLAFAAILNVTAAGMAWRLFAGVLGAEDRARTAAEAANRAKSEFLAAMSHEIRTPLNGVLGMTQAMAAGNLEPEQRERLRVIRDSSKQLLAILNDILDISKIEARKLEIEHVEFDLSEALGAVAATFAPIASQRGLELSVDLAEAGGVYRGDPTRFRQIVSNLVSNAVKFTPAGSVKVEASREGDVLVVDVIDTGIGISPEAANNVFGKFVQADASTTRQFGGTGLGLAICRDLAELMGGSITLRSTPGIGSTFRLRLPLVRIAGPAPPRPLTIRIPASDPDAPPRLRILAAEDNHINRLVLKTLLGQIGLHPDMVGNGALAVEAWRMGGYDVILMDIQMPEMDGLAATREIRAEEAATGRPRTPILGLTANAMSHQVDDYRAAGMDGHVAKPIDVAKLFAALEDVLADAEGIVKEAAPVSLRA